MSIHIIQAGAFTTIQDAGRPGYAHLGVPLSGAMDGGAMRLANQLLGNPPDTAVLEITQTGIHFRITTECSIALAGAEFDCYLNEVQLDCDSSIDLKPGDEFRMKRLRRGIRAYLALAGGLAVEELLGSRATLVVAGLGGFQGRALQKGDVLQLLQPQLMPRKQKHDWQKIKSAGRLIVHAMPGPEFKSFNTVSQKQIFSQAFVVNRQSDRMGYRLQGPMLEMNEATTAGRMPSSGLIPGTVQVTPSGQCILAMRDAQTTGGYPRIVVINQQDIDLLAQSRPGDEVMFFRVK